MTFELLEGVLPAKDIETLRGREWRGDSGLLRSYASTSHIPQLREEAINALGRMRDEKSVPMLISVALDDRDEIVASAAQVALAGFGGAVVPRLIAELHRETRGGETQDTERGATVVRLLGETGDRRALECLLALVGDSVDGPLHREALESVRRLSQDALRVVSGALRELRVLRDAPDADGSPRAAGLASDLRTVVLELRLEADHELGK